MDLKLSPTPTKSADDTEIDTPPHTRNYTQPIKNHHHHLSPPPPPPAAAVLTYKECLKNHAAALGGHAVDGCGEFMPSSTTADPTSLKCAACGCHRNFHRREPDSPTSTPITPPFLDFRHPYQPKISSLSPSSPPPLPPIGYAPNTLLALSTAVAVEEHHQAPLTPTGEYPVGRKRFRTKFSQEQKEKMQSFSEKLGWKMLKRDEGEVEEFCGGIGITKGVLKVWMHNNKNTLGKKLLEIGNNNGSFDNNGGRVISFENNNNYNNGGVLFHGSNNGSSSSSH